MHCQVFAKDFDNTYFVEQLLAAPSECRIILADLSLVIVINYDLIKKSIFHQLIKFQYQSFFTSQDIKQSIFLNSSLYTGGRHILYNLSSVSYSYEFRNGQEGKKQEEGNRKILNTSRTKVAFSVK